jgi:histone acetyltransferase
MDELARRPKRAPHFAAMQMILTEMQNHAAAWPFVQPVNKEEVPDYYLVVQEPMDLSTMEKKLDSDQYTTPDEFVRDAKLIFQNCRAYNAETTTYYKVLSIQYINFRMQIDWKSSSWES